MTPTAARRSRTIASVSGSGSSPNETSILFVCTANQCRSPFAAAIARQAVGTLPFVIASAGLMNCDRTVPPNGLQVAAEFGLDLADHRSRRADLSGLEGWDVILTMTREHVREIVAVAPGLWPRVFTIKQFRRWIESNPPSRRTRLGPWIDIAAADRSRFDMVGTSTGDEIDDPLHSPSGAWRGMARVLQGEIGAILAVLSVPSRPARL